MDGWWECERLDIFFRAKVLRAGLENQLPTMLKIRLCILGARLINLQSKKRARIVGKEHYDLGNDLFSRMLDPYMQYFLRLLKDADTLEAAQQSQAEINLRCATATTGDVLHIGCGWGGLSQYMATHYGVSVVGATISAEQQKMAQTRCEGLMSPILLEDYRDLNDQFDRIVPSVCSNMPGQKTGVTPILSVVDRNLNRMVFPRSILLVLKTDHNVDPRDQ